MYHFSANHSLSTLVTHVGEDDNPHHTHVSPIYQTSTFNFPDVATGAGIVARTEPGYYYTRLGKPQPGPPGAQDRHPGRARPDPPPAGR